ncbi:MAG: putative ABC transporter permease [Oscillospiraceae bacterium]|nr:putative ABC transporter permease [Oscillospiraceae bacterium]
MNYFLIFAYLFFTGSVTGWIIELIFRNIRSQNSVWINPGFCTGPYLPIYGFGLCFLYLLASLEKFSFVQNPVLNKIILFAAMALCMTAVEYIAGIFCLKFLKVRLWDYSENFGNVQGIICPLFSFFWAVLSAVYYFFIHPHILEALDWLSKNLAFSFFIGMFFGIFIIDIMNSTQIIAKIKAFAEEHALVMKYEEVKTYIVSYRRKNKKKYLFFRQFSSEIPLSKQLENMTKKRNKIEERKKKRE